MQKTLRTLIGASLATLGLSGCVNGFWFGVAPKEGIIKPSIKPYEPPVYAPVTGATPEPYKPDPPIVINPITGNRENAETGAVLRGSAQAPALVKVTSTGALVDARTGQATGYHYDPATGHYVNDKGEVLANATAVEQASFGATVALPKDSGLKLPTSDLPSSDPNAAIKTVDGLRVSDVDAGSTLFLETKGLKPSTDYTGTLIWPNGKRTEQPLKSTAGGNIQGAQGNFIEYPHVGFYEADITPGEPGVVTGDFRVEITEKGATTPTQSVYFSVRPRPVIFSVSDTHHERVVFFSDRPDKVFLHAEGLPPETLVDLWVVVANINRFTQLQDGMTLDDKVFDNLKGLTFRSNAKGVFDAQLMAWPTREAVTDSLVVIGKYLNSEHKYVQAEDLAISDHPTFLIKSGADFFGATDPSTIIKATK